MILSRSQGIVGGRLLPVDGPPWVQSAFIMPQYPGSGPCLIQCAVTVIQQMRGDLRVCVDKYREHIHFRIPEIMPLIALTGKSLCGYITVLIPAR